MRVIYESREEVEVAAAEEERQFNIIVASMQTKPSPDDFKTLELAQKRRDRAEDLRALLARWPGA
jgi:hypothetical protein